MFTVKEGLKATEIQLEVGERGGDTCSSFECHEKSKRSKAT